MRIITKHKDYYDSARGYGGVDNTTVYIRKTEEIEIKGTRDDYHNHEFWGMHYWRSNSWTFGVSTGSIFFCGTEYPYYRFTFPEETLRDENGYVITQYHRPAPKYLFPNYQDDEIEAVFCKKYRRSKPNKYRKDDLREDVMRSHLDHHKVNYDKIHLEYDCPVIQVFANNSREYVVVKNPILKKLGFQRVMDPYQAFQELNMYMNGPLTRVHEVEPLPLTEEDQVRRRGFDKWTFRRKSNK